MRKIKNIITFSATLLLTIGVFVSCGDNAEEHSFSLDHKLPDYKIYNDSLVVNKGQTVDLKVDFSDESGLGKIAFAYTVWGYSENISLTDTPANFTFEKTITIPEDAETEWTETIQRNDGSTFTIQEQYHKLEFKVTDKNLNVRTVYVRIKVNP